LSSTPQFNGEQLAAARKVRWHQEGDALLTLEAAREWVSELGLVLFAPRAHQLPTAAPSLVEATLGRAVNAPSAAESETARSLVGRMVTEGAALPLNLLGGPGDVPDFVASAQVFSYVFTLRGDKAWKQAPATSGSLKVSLLAAKVYETLAQGNAMTAAELASELGREVTETAIVRALVELWAQLRVIPLLQPDAAGAKSSGAMWELTSRRFTKQMKAGANAGQPTALSALISLYLAQALAATEEEVETFLSPLVARSKVRDVLHGLRAARQLESVVLEGKTLLYVPGALPEFPEIAATEPEKEANAPQAGAVPSEPPRERIRRFDQPRAVREERKGAPRRERGERPFRGDRDRPSKPLGERPSKPFDGKRERPKREGGGFSDRERRPFQRDRAQGERKSFTRPWDEQRTTGERKEGRERPVRFERERPRRDGETRPPREKREFRAGPRSSGPRQGGAERGERTQRPFRARAEGERPFRPRREGDRPAGKRREGERPFRPRTEAERSSRPRRESERPFRPRREGGAESAERPSRKPFVPRKEGARENRGERGRGEKPAGKPYFGEKRFGEKRKFGDTKFGDKKRFAGKPGKPKFGGKSGGNRGVRKGKSKPRREPEE